MLDATSIFALCNRTELRQKVCVNAAAIAFTVFTENVGNLTGNTTEHSARWALSKLILANDDPTINALTRQVVLQMQDDLTLPGTSEEYLDTRASQLAASITDADITTALNTVWSFVGGFDQALYTYNNP